MGAVTNDLIFWFSSSNQKATIVYNLIRHALNAYSVNRFFHRETLMKAVLIHLEWFARGPMALPI